MELVARRYDTAEPVRVVVAGERIAAIELLSQRESPGGELPWLSPGWFDIQFNGYAGQEFSSPELTVEGVAQIARTQYAFGVTRFCPTLTTQSEATLAHGMRTIAAACEQSPEVARLVAGIHLEGPYLSRADGPRGAHPAEHCRPPDWEHFCRLQAAAGGRIAMVTLAPEYPETPDFVRRAVASGVRVALGHTAATGPQIRAAVDAGASLSTHLGNGAAGMLRRHPNPIWDQLAEDRLCASLIVDGHHLPREVVQTMVRAKTPARIILVSDISGWAGLPPGRYQSSGCELEILPDGRLVVAGQDQLLAGASRPIGAGVTRVMEFAGVSLADAVAMASSQPARWLGRPVTSLAANAPADLVLFDLPPAQGQSAPRGELTVRATLSAGRLVYGTLSDS